MVPFNFPMPRLAQAMKFVPQVRGMVFQIMDWLAKVKARCEKVMGFLAGSVSGTCSALTSAAATIPRAVPPGKWKPAHVYVNIGGLATSVIPDKKV